MAGKALADRTLACVIWNDAHGSASGEYSVEEIDRTLHEPSVIVTFGLLIQDDERGITLASEITSFEAPLTYRGVSFIPRGMVKETILLGVPKRPSTPRAKKIVLVKEEA